MPRTSISPRPQFPGPTQDWRGLALRLSKSVAGHVWKALATDEYDTQRNHDLPRIHQRSPSSSHSKPPEMVELNEKVQRPLKREDLQTHPNVGPHAVPTRAPSRSSNRGRTRYYYGYFLRITSSMTSLHWFLVGMFLGFVLRGVLPPSKSACGPRVPFHLCLSKR